MVNFSENFINNLLSTSVDRNLYEALWLVSAGKGNRVQKSKYNFNNVSIENLCNELIKQWQTRGQLRDRFILSTQLAFGALYVYQFQIDKLYGQVQNALRRVAVYDLNWMASDPPISIPSTQKSSGVKKSDAKYRKHNATTKNLIDCYENFFIDMDKEEVNVREEGDGFEPVITNVQAITILEPTTLMTSGFQLFDKEMYEDNFGATENDNFQELDEPDCLQSKIYETASALLIAIDRNNNDNSNVPVFIESQVSSLMECTIQQKQRCVYEITDADELLQSNAKVEASELELCELSDDLEEASKKRKISKLIIDKTTSFNREVMKKNWENYEKHTVNSPLKNFPVLKEQLKMNVNVLFNISSNRLKHSEVLSELFKRNMKKVPHEDSKKRKNTGIDKENKKRRISHLIHNNNDQSGDLNLGGVIELPPVFEEVVEISTTPQQCRKNNYEYDGTKLSKKEILQKLKKLWKMKVHLVTMDKLCEGLSRFAAAVVFFELMILSKENVVEIQQKPDSLEIGIIKCSRPVDQIF